jgi:hypothetical protein
MVIFAALLCADKGTVVPVRRLCLGEYRRFEFGFRCSVSDVLADSEQERAARVSGRYLPKRDRALSC